MVRSIRGNDMNDAKIAAELRDEGVDIDACDKEMDDLFASVLAEGGMVDVPSH